MKAFKVLLIALIAAQAALFVGGQQWGTINDRSRRLVE
jgi:DNA-binding transcriptional regulator of glucitol operon